MHNVVFALVCASLLLAGCLYGTPQQPTETPVASPTLQQTIESTPQPSPTLTATSVPASQANGFSEVELKNTDCLAQEQYDKQAGSCTPKCSNEEECAKQEQADNTAATDAGDDFFSGNQSFKEKDSKPDAVIVRYEIQGDYTLKLIEKPSLSDASLKKFQDDDAKHQEMWKRYSTLFPRAYNPFLIEFVVNTDGKGNTLGSVHQHPDNKTNWVLSLDVQDAYPDGANFDKGDMTYTIIHEFGHLLALNHYWQLQSPDQVSEEACKPRYFTQEGCALENSYINKYVPQFWKDLLEEHKSVQGEEAVTKFYEKYANRFVTDYAATNPEEDIAESWTAFVLKDKQSGSEVKELKTNFFYDFPELVKLRTLVRSRLS